MTSLYYIEKKFIKYLKNKYRKKLKNKKIYVYGAGYMSKIYTLPILDCYIKGFIDDYKEEDEFLNKPIYKLKEVVNDADIICMGISQIDIERNIIQKIKKLNKNVKILSFRKEIIFLDLIEEFFSRKKLLDLNPQLQDIEDLEAIFQITKAILNKNPNALICEVGSWKGGSAIVIGSAIMMYGKNAKLICVDNWEYKDNTSETNKHLTKELKEKDVQKIFLQNIINLGFHKYIEFIRGTSKDVKNRYKDKVFDMIFIDADHRYSAFKKDLENLKRKVKDEGILCGHDCLGYLDEFPEDLINQNLEKDYILFNNKLLHCGVVKACNDVFNKDYKIFPNSRVWYFSKNNDLINDIKLEIDINECKDNKILCPICNNSSSLLYVKRNFHKLYKCSNCNHIFVSNIEEKKILKKYEFEEIYNPSLFFEDDSFIKDRLYHISLHTTLEDKKNILEIGCFDGNVLGYLKEKGKNVYGVEINKIAAEKAKNKGVNLCVSPLEKCNFKENFFDLIYSFHTLDHLLDVDLFYNKVHSLLKKGGVLITHIPLEEIDFGNPDHLHIFSKKSIIKLHKKYFNNYKITEANIVTNADVLTKVLTISSIK